MSDDYPIGQTVFDRQRLILRRQWELLEGLKQQRNRLPIVICTVLLTTTAFVLESARLPSSPAQAVAIALILVTIALTGIVVGRVIHKRYNFVNRRIKYLYTRMNIAGDDFFVDDDSQLDDAKTLFGAVYFVIATIGAICALGVALAGPKP